MDDEHGFCKYMVFGYDEFSDDVPEDMKVYFCQDDEVFVMDIEYYLGQEGLHIEFDCLESQKHDLNGGFYAISIV